MSSHVIPLWSLQFFFFLSSPTFLCQALSWIFRYDPHVSYFEPAFPVSCCHVSGCCSFGLFPGLIETWSSGYSHFTHHYHMVVVQATTQIPHSSAEWTLSWVVRTPVKLKALKLLVQNIRVIPVFCSLVFISMALIQSEILVWVQEFSFC